MPTLTISVDPHAPEPLYAQVARQLRTAIAAGLLLPGESLPPIRTLAEQLGCTSSTISRAYVMLREAGLVVARRGGGTRVAEMGDTAVPWMRDAHLVNGLERQVLDALGQGYTMAEIEAAFSLALARWRDAADSSAPARPAPAADLAFAGSHDLSIEALFRLTERHPDHPHTHVSFVGSLGGLMALAEGTADMAGVHLLDETGEYNLPYVRRLLPGQHAVVVHLVTRLVGWIVPPGNPRRLTHWDDLAQPGLRLVNRQRGSGTRVLLDRQIERLGLTPAQLAGYAREKSTHIGVAQAVADGEADAGLGIYAAARALALDFVPLVEEPYDLVVPAEKLNHPAIQATLATAQSQEFRAVVLALGGYRVERGGNKIQV